MRAKKSLDLVSYELHVPGRATSKDFKAWEKCKPNLQLQCGRSPNLLGVRSSDWYHNKAHGLYFHFLKTFFVFKTKVVTKSGQNRVTLDQISDQFHWVFPS